MGTLARKRWSFAAVLLLPLAASAQNAALPDFPVETVHSDADREIAERIHAIVRKVAPELTPRTWYGMPAYSKDDKVVCFFKDAGKFKDRYSTFGFNDKANLDDGSMWPTSYALTKLTKADEKKIGELVSRAVSE